MPPSSSHWKALAQAIVLHAAALALLLLAVSWPSPFGQQRAGQADAPAAVQAYLGDVAPTPSAEAAPVPSMAADPTATPGPPAASDQPMPSGVAAVVAKAEARPEAVAETESSAATTAATVPATSGQPRAGATQSGQDEESDELYGRYLAAFRTQLFQAWDPEADPELSDEGPIRCQVLLTQLEGGQLVDVAFLDCPHSPALRQSLVRAFAKDRPWPYAGFEPVFRSHLRLSICHPASACLAPDTPAQGGISPRDP